MDNTIEMKPNKKALGLLSATHFMSDAYGGFALPIMPLIAANLNLSLGLVGILISISSMASSFLQPIFGYLSDKITRRFFVFWGIILSAVFISLIGHISNFWLLCLVFMFGNMGVGLFHPQASALAAHFSGKKINTYMGIFVAWGTIGYAAGPFISAFLTENFGLKSTIWVMIPGLISAYLLYVFLPKAPLHGKPPDFKDVKKMIFSLKRILFILIFISIIRAVVIYSFHVYMPFVWQKAHYSILTIGTTIAAFSFCGGISSYIGGHLTNYFGRKNILIYSFLPAIPCLIGTLIFLKTIPILAFGLFVISGFLLMSSTSVNMVIAQMAAPENKGLLSGLTGGFCWGIAGIIQTPVGFIANHIGIEKILLVLAFLPILATVAALFIPEEYA